MNTEPSQNRPQFTHISDLAVEVPIASGTRVRVLEDGIVYTSVGQTDPKIAEQLGWKQGTIWMPDHALRRIIKDRHHPLRDPIAAATAVLRDPTSVHAGSEVEFTYFFASAELLRQHGWIASHSMRWVDAVVESRQAFDGRRFLRLFHLSPATRNKGGKQLWP